MKPEHNRGVCHCGADADGHILGYCSLCSDVRCDAYPGACAPCPQSFCRLCRDANDCGSCGECNPMVPTI
jgi:hypothetical protein